MPKKHTYNKTTGRKYGAGSYDHKYNNTPKARANRAARMRARRAIITALAKKIGRKAAIKRVAGKEVDHKRPLSKGGSNSVRNLKVISAKKNRAKDRPRKKK